MSEGFHKLRLLLAAAQASEAAERHADVAGALEEAGIYCDEMAKAARQKVAENHALVMQAIERAAAKKQAETQSVQSSNIKEKPQ